MQPKDFTAQEKIIADCLSKLGLRYMEQAPFNNYRVDFWVPELAMIIEADGKFGHLRKADAKRDWNLMNWESPKVENILHITAKTPPTIMEELCRALDNL